MSPAERNVANQLSNMEEYLCFGLEASLETSFLSASIALLLSWLRPHVAFLICPEMAVANPIFVSGNYYQKIKK